METAKARARGKRTARRLLARDAEAAETAQIPRKDDVAPRAVAVGPAVWDGLHDIQIGVLSPGTGRRAEIGGLTVKNTLGDLNNYLFGQLELLDNLEASDEELKQNIERAKTVATVAAQIINNGNLVLKVATRIAEGDDARVLKMLTGGTEKP
jgi:hypothetical protein